MPKHTTKQVMEYVKSQGKAGPESAMLLAAYKVHCFGRTVTNNRLTDALKSIDFATGPSKAKRQQYYGDLHDTSTKYLWEGRRVAEPAPGGAVADDGGRVWTLDAECLKQAEELVQEFVELSKS